MYVRTQLGLEDPATDPACRKAGQDMRWDSRSLGVAFAAGWITGFPRFVAKAVIGIDVRKLWVCVCVAGGCSGRANSHSAKKSKT